MRPYRILVVDDNADIVDMLAEVLQLLGHCAVTARSGEEALGAMSAEPPDLVIMDVGMPGMSGHEVVRRVATEPWRARCVFVAMTGWGRDEDRERAIEAGFDVHVAKPLDLDRLRALLEAVSAPAPDRAPLADG